MANILTNDYKYELDYTGKYINDFLGTNAIDTVDYYADLNDSSKVPDARITGYETEEKISQNSIPPEHSKIFYVVNGGRMDETTKKIVDVDGIEIEETINGEKVEVIKYKRGFYQFIGYWLPTPGISGSYTLHRYWKYIEELSDGGKVFTGTYLAPEKVGKIVKDQDIGNKSVKTIIQLMFSDLQLDVPTFTTNFKLSTFPSKMYINAIETFKGTFTIGSYTNGTYGNDIITSTIKDLKISLSKTVNETFNFTPITINFEPSTTSIEDQKVSDVAYSGTTSYRPTSSDFGKKISFTLSGSFTYTNPQTSKSVTETISSTITSTVYQYYYYGYSKSSTDTDIDTFKTKTLESSSTFSSLSTTAVSLTENKFLMIAIPKTMGGNENMTSLTMTPTSGGQPASLTYVGSKSLNSDTYYIYRSGSANSSWAAYKITK